MNSPKVNGPTDFMDESPGQGLLKSGKGEWRSTSGTNFWFRKPGFIVLGKDHVQQDFQVSVIIVIVIPVRVRR